MKAVDLTDKRFGNLVVLYKDTPYISPKGQKQTRWVCKCDCGNTRSFRNSELNEGRTNCGCKKYSHKFNEVLENGEYLIICVGKEEVIIDKEDLIKILPSRVSIGGNGYAYSRRQLLHRLIMGFPKNCEIDHINHNPLDNRKENLRIVNRSENGMNRKPMSNTGNYGITLRKDGYFMVTIDDKYRGIRRTLEDAISLRDKSLIGTKQEKINFYLNGEGVMK